MILVSVPLLFYNLNKWHHTEFKKHKVGLLFYTLGLLVSINYDFYFDVVEEYL